MNGLMHCSKIASLFDHLVRAEQGQRHVRAGRRRGLEIDHEFGVGRGPFEIAGQLRLIDRAARSASFKSLRVTHWRARGTARRIMRVLISGAGIAGLTVAYWLRRYGFTPAIVERAPSLLTDGYKIDVRGTALQVLRRMGIHDAVVAASTDMQGALLVDKNGKVINEMTGDAFGHRVGEDLEHRSRYFMSDPDGPHPRCRVYL